MQQTQVPLICISKNGSLQLIPVKWAFLNVTAASLLREYWNGDNLFDADGVKWAYSLVADKFKPNFFTKVIAGISGGPRFEANAIWTNTGPYKLEELKEQIKYCVDKDDDILTQFEEAHVIKMAVNEAATFADIIKVLNKYVFNVNEEALWKEQEGR